MRAVTRQPVRKWWMQQAAGLSCLQRKTAERHRERSNKKSGESKARQRGQLALQEELKSPLAADRRQQQSRATTLELEWWASGKAGGRQLVAVGAAEVAADGSGASGCGGESTWPAVNERM